MHCLLFIISMLTMLRCSDAAGRLASLKLGPRTDNNFIEHVRQYRLHRDNMSLSVQTQINSTALLGRCEERRPITLDVRVAQTECSPSWSAHETPPLSQAA